MMLPQDALKLAVTKLRTRRIRLFVSILVASLLFIVLSATSIIMNGALNSVEDFSDEGLGKRYIARVDSVASDDFSLYSDPRLIAEANKEFEAHNKEKAALAKELGIFFDPKLEQPPAVSDGGPDGEDFLDSSSPIVQDILEREQIKKSAAHFEAVAAKAAEYDAVGVYQSVLFGSSYSQWPAQGGNIISVIEDGKEVVSDMTTAYNPLSNNGFASITQSGITAMSNDILESFTLPDTTLDPEDNIIAIIAPYSAAEEVLRLPKLPKDATSDAKLARLKEVREKAASVTFDLCIRNQVSTDRQQQALQHQADLKANVDDSKYVKPDLLYDTSSKPCVDVVVVQDKRTAEQKKEEANQKRFNDAFGLATEPTQRIASFRIVGISPDQPTFENFSVTDILGSLLASNVGNGWIMPLSESSKLPEFKADFAKVGVVSSYDRPSYIELSDAETARKFIKNESCEVTDFMEGQGSITITSLCDEQGKPFFAYPFGSSSIALEEVRSTFTRVFTTALFVIAIISALIMMGTVGKIISDSRRETAVFRAIGAKRLDITQIYITYALLLGVFIVLFSVGAGWLIAQFVDNRYAQEFTVDSLVAFNASDLSKTFSLNEINWQQTSQLAGIVLIGSFVSAIIPLASNLRRNPIKDMRDER